jgi:glyoxylase-like metal-dependent hydrolase (beta-lactamase superfamily II)
MSDTAPRQKKQEQLPATDEIVEVAPNILRTQLPIDFTGLGHVNMYVMEDSRGVAVVDPGLPNKESWSFVQKRLKQIGIPMRRVHSVVVTHSHPDHFGGAGKFRKENNSEIITHRLFQTWWDPSDPGELSPEEAAEFFDRPQNFSAWGQTQTPGPPQPTLAQRMLRIFNRLMPTPKPSVRLRDAERISLAGREWVAVHTPGHTPDHLCLFDAECGVFLSGDHVLPNITPHVPGITKATDPLQVFFDSLDKGATFDAQTQIILPAHGQPFTGMQRRVDEIKQHHFDRLTKLREACIAENRPLTVQEYSTHLFAPHVLGPMAYSECYAHLEHLRANGTMRRRDREDGLAEYVLA